MPENRTIPLRRGPLAQARNIAVLVFDRVSLFHFSVPLLVFGEDREELGVPRFNLRVCASEPGPLRSAVGLTVMPTSGLRGLQSADIIIVPGWREVNERPSAEVLLALQRAYRRGATIVGLCLGAFVLAEAGLLDGKTATTHWNWAAAFRERFPQVRLEPDVLYVDEGRILTSAGTAAGLDCCLHLLQRICGARVANRVARRLVIAPHRAGGQAQFVEEPMPQSAAGDRLGAVLAWAAGHLRESHSIESLAQRAAMSRRSFTRHFQKATGASVLQWLLQKRLAAASRLLEDGTQPVEAIATAVGFGSAASLRQHFMRSYGLSPQAYRRQFRPSEATPDVAAARVRMR